MKGINNILGNNQGAQSTGQQPKSKNIQDEIYTMTNESTYDKIIKGAQQAGLMDQ
jgi:hypothetical protein